MNATVRLLFLTITLGLGFAAPAVADGPALLESAPVELTAEDLERLAASRPHVPALLETVEIRQITYRSDGLKVKGYWLQPAGAAGEKLPCVIYNRGGNREFGALSDGRAAAILAEVASWGYVVVASQYRGNAGGEGQEEFGGAEVADVLNLLDVLEEIPRADPARVGLYGWSRGGLMTYLALRRSERFAAAVVGAGLADAFTSVRLRPDMEKFVYRELVPGYEENREAALTARSPKLWAEDLHKATPILLLHGTADWRVHPTQALEMAQALFEARHPFRLVLLEGGDHGLSEHRLEVSRQVRSWLDHYVRDRGRLPDLEPHGR